ncbi:MAG: RraA family protein, partial [Pseudomonadota bacterium]
MSDALWAKLRDVDTPTVCNAIEVAQGKRGFDAFTRGTFQASEPNDPAMVGFARTAQIAGKEPPTEAPDVIRARRMDYFRHMDAGDLPKVAVTEDLDGSEAVSAWWGEVHTTVHKGLGCVGAITSGPMRDLGDMAEGFPVIASSIGPSHAFVHVRTIGAGATVHGLTFQDGDL